MRAVYPKAFGLYDGTGVLPRRELQRRNDCLTFGITSAAEALFARAGRPVQWSARFLYWVKDPLDQSIEGYIRLINRVGLCPDALCPYDPELIEAAPGPAAWLALEPIRLSAERIAGREEVINALCSGHSIVSVRGVGEGEHCEAITRYDEVRGFEVHGSGNDLTWFPWGALAGEFTQLYALSCEQAPAVPCPGYAPAPVPAFELGELRIPELQFVHPFSLEPRARETFFDVVVHFAGGDLGAVAQDQDSVTGRVPLWRVGLQVLMLPVVDVTIDGITTRLHRVTLTRPAVQIMSYTPAESSAEEAA